MIDDDWLDFGDDEEADVFDELQELALSSGYGMQGVGYMLDLLEELIDDGMSAEGAFYEVCREYGLGG